LQEKQLNFGHLRGSPARAEVLDLSAAEPGSAQKHHAGGKFRSNFIRPRRLRGGRHGTIPRGTDDCEVRCVAV
jgi:hypothetical protein